MTKPKGIYFCAENSWGRVYGPDQRRAIQERLDIPQTLVTRETWRAHRTLLKEAEVIVSSWGGPILEEEILAALPNLKAYFYGAGSINGLMTDAAWKRGIRITHAAPANAVSVAEFSLAQIILSLKRGWYYMQEARKSDAAHLWGRDKPVPGTFGSTVGLVSLGYVSRALCRFLNQLDTRVLAYCPFTNEKQAEHLGVELTSLERLFSESDVVSIHAPLNDQTRSMIGTSLLERMKPDSTLINTARGDIINQSELITFLESRTDVYACIDVTHPEPPEADCKLLQLPNTVLTPHLAGSMHRESYRLGQSMIAEIDRYLKGQDMAFEVTREMAARLA